MNLNEKQQRTNSDDWVYTVYRRQYVKDHHNGVSDNQKQRPKSLDWDLPGKLCEEEFKNATDSRSLGTGKKSMVLDAIVPTNIRRISLDSI